ncbi:MAG: methyltransferase domain-containing protein [Actinophytocola sp.]|uniref:class I SAM-dependent methyltransferase n=1 Tax=Actinophytocola sp. TaxID=1872138 RepID=UPI00132704BB|nr:class I SAM-dependent methyltransferase [Actinophytocola sp.]MPZ81561.1 methyltransferase domain-containing protein [Actinophytocola sp.]
MTETDRERLRTTFGEDAERYDRRRPGYPAELFGELTAGPRSRVLEIGCGTGQATLPLARLGCAVIAVELSEDMATIARRHLAGFPTARVVVSAFEDWPLPADPFDIVLSATAFHWLDPDVRMRKAADALRPGGSLALVSTHHVAGGTEPFFAEVQRCYERFDPDTPPGLRLSRSDGIPTDSTEFDRSGRFGPVRFRRYEWEQTYRSREYEDLLLTYSGHRALPQPRQSALLACIANLVDTGYGGRITKRYMTQLAVAHLR